TRDVVRIKGQITWWRSCLRLLSLLSLCKKERGESQHGSRHSRKSDKRNRVSIPHVETPFRTPSSTSLAQTRAARGGLWASGLQLPCSRPPREGCGRKRPPPPCHTCRCRQAVCLWQQTRIEDNCQNAGRPWPEQSSPGADPQF